MLSVLVETEQSSASASHQTFTSCGALECHREYKKTARERGKGMATKERKSGLEKTEKREEEDDEERSRQ